MSNLLRFFIAIIALTPFVTEFRLGDDHFYSDSSLLKLVFSGIGLLFILLLFLVESVKKKSIVIYYIKPLIPVILFISWGFVTLFWVSDYLLAGKLLFQFVIYAIGLMLVINLVKTFRDLKFLLIFIVMSLVGVSIIGLLQYYLPDYYFVQNLFLQTATPGATFVNKNMASHFVVMTLPISVGLLLAANTRSKISIYSVSMAISSWFLIYTVARQAYLAIAVEMLILLLFFIIDFFKNSSQSLFNETTLKGDKSIALIVVVLFLAFASNFTNTGWNSDSVKINRVQTIATDSDNPRIPAWANTIEMIKDNPLIGVGVGQWSVKYPIYYDSSMKDVIFNEKTRAKKLHNDYLEMFANVGLIGYIFLLWLAFLVAKQSWSVLKNPLNPNRIYYLSIVLGMVGFSVVAFFSFPIGVYFPALLLFIYIGLLWFKDTQEVFSVNKKYFCIFVSIVIILATSIYSYKHLLSKHYVRLANESVVNNNFSYDYNLLIKALRLAPESWIANQSLGRLLLVNEQPKKAVSYLSKARAIKPYHSFSALNLARAYEKSENSIYERGTLESLVTFDPRNVRAWGRLVQVYVEAKEKDMANMAYKNMKISFEYFKNRPNFGPYHDVAIGISMYVGEHRYTEYIYDHLISTQPLADNYVDYGMFADKYLKNKLKAKELFIKALELHPESIIPKYIKENYNL